MWLHRARVLAFIRCSEEEWGLPTSTTYLYMGWSGVKTVVTEEVELSVERLIIYIYLCQLWKTVKDMIQHVWGAISFLLIYYWHAFANYNVAGQVMMSSSFRKGLPWTTKNVHLSVSTIVPTRAYACRATQLYTFLYIETFNARAFSSAINLPSMLSVV